MKLYLLDTHIWIWFAQGNSELSKSTRKIINIAASKAQLFISAISLWELSMLTARGRIDLSMPGLDWLNQTLDFIPLQVSNLTPSIALDSCNLPGNFHEDPADRIIVATARVEQMTLITRDKKIIDYGHQHNYVSILKA